MKLINRITSYVGFEVPVLLECMQVINLLNSNPSSINIISVHPTYLSFWKVTNSLLMPHQENADHVNNVFVK